MEHVRGTFRKSGTPVVEDADIHLIVNVNRRWYGSFELPVDTPMQEPGAYTLQLQDGRYGDVVVTAIRCLVGCTVGQFAGNGPLHEPVI
jgi:hypothetical protein